MAGIRPQSRPGKITGLVRFDEESGGALDYDCMTLLGVRLSDVPATDGWDGLSILFEHLPPESASWRHAHRDEADFSSGLGRAALLADLFDAVRLFNYSFAKKGTTEPKPYPRPWLRRTEAYGSGAIAPEDFDGWYYGR